MGSASKGAVQRGAGAAAAPLRGKHELQPRLPGAPAAGEAAAVSPACAREAEVYRCASLDVKLRYYQLRHTNKKSYYETRIIRSIDTASHDRHSFQIWLRSASQ